MKRNNLRLEREHLRKEENRKFILKAAEKVFGRKGYAQATVDEIAGEAQFSKATLYRYFVSKKDIFLEIILNSFEEVDKKITQILMDQGSAAKKIWELIYYISWYCHKKKNIARIFFMERQVLKKVLKIDIKKPPLLSNHHPPIPYKFKVKMENIFNSICGIIREGIESGEFRKVDVKDAAFIFGAMVRGFHFRGPMRNREYSIKESTDLLHSFFLNGIKKETKG